MSELKSDSITVTSLGGLDVLVIRKSPSSDVFITTSDSIIIGKRTFSTLLNFLVKNEIISYKVLRGILEEYSTE